MLKEIDQVTSLFTDEQWMAIQRGCQHLQLDTDDRVELIESIEAASDAEREMLICAIDWHYFVNTYIHIFDAEAASWIKFDLWPEQSDALDIFVNEQKTIVLKARQLGLTWLALSLALWLMLFRPIATILIFSRRETESIYLLSDERMRGMYQRLPEFMKAESVDTTNKSQFKLSNGSVAYAFPTSAGDSYTATLAIVDEADLVPDLNQLLRSIEPTINAGGKLLLISRSDKDNPQSEFKKIYRAAKAKLNSFASVFLPWYVRPARTQAWYEKQKRDTEAQTGGLDDLYEQYPATDDEALAPASLNKRVRQIWLKQCYDDKTLPVKEADYVDEMDMPGLVVYKKPERGTNYFIGSDCAEGLPSSDNSTSYIIDEQGEEVAHLVGKYTPEVHGVLTAKLAQWYNHARIMVENNNHGHAFILAVKTHGSLNLLAKGHIKNKIGWSSTTTGKVIMYDHLSEAVKEQECTIHDLDCYLEIQSVEKDSLRAPEGEHDDRSDAFALAICCRIYSKKTTPSVHVLE